MNQALPLILRGKMIDSVLWAQCALGGQVTAADVLAHCPGLRLARSAKGFAELAGAVAALGPDAQGRALVACGVDRTGAQLWHADVPDLRVEYAVRLAAAAARPGEDAMAVIVRALEALR